MQSPSTMTRSPLATPEGALPRSLAGLCKAAADPLRLDIMRVLARDSFGVQELAAILEVPQPGMSHHLKILSQAGLLVTRRQGNFIFYRRALSKNETPLDAFQSELYAAIDATPIPESYVRRMNSVHKERSRQSREFFDRFAQKFQQSQGMLCELSQYLPNVRELLDLMKLDKTARVMEVGPGQGELLEEMSSRYGEIVALDSSQEMLSLTRSQIEKRSPHIEFVNSSLENFSSTAKRFDAVVLNMVLHHMASPARIFQKIRELMKPGGYLLVCDLCSHNQDWVQKACGDVWLGFEPKDLSDWAKSAGFEENQSLYLALKNGFQIQLKLFRGI